MAVHLSGCCGSLAFSVNPREEAAVFSNAQLTVLTHRRPILPQEPSQEFLPKYIEQGAKQGPSSQYAERAGSGLKALISSDELRGLSVRAQVRVYRGISVPRMDIRHS